MRAKSTDQDDRSQLDQLEAAGCERIYRDVTSGKLARRPDWDRCLDQLRRGDQLVITRMARSVRHLTESPATRVLEPGTRRGTRPVAGRGPGLPPSG